MHKVMLAVAALVASFGAVANAQQQQWIEHRSPELGFSAHFPQAPQTASERRQSNDKKVAYTANTFQAAGKDREFFIAVFEYPPGILPRNPDANYWSARVRDFANGSVTSVVREGPITLAGQGGVEAVTTSGKGASYLLDVILRGNRLYTMVSGGPDGHESSPDAIRFRDSLRLLGP